METKIISSDVTATEIVKTFFKPTSSEYYYFIRSLKNMNFAKKIISAGYSLLFKDGVVLITINDNIITATNQLTGFYITAKKVIKINIYDNSYDVDIEYNIENTFEVFD